MARFCPLFSSSSGNCIYIGSGSTNILIDCGVSARRIVTALAEIGLVPAAVNAVFVTHAHSDHVCGLSGFAVRRGIPIYASALTVETLSENPALKDASFRIIDGTVTLPDLSVTPFSTSHDSPGSSGYRVDINDENHFAVCTDTGVVSDEIRGKLSGCNLVMLESNYDVAMLTNGPYTYQMKQRISSDTGHLSNGSCAKELPALIKKGTTRIILGHLSQNNNNPETAYTTATAEIIKHGYTENEDYILYVAPDKGGRMFSL